MLRIWSEIGEDFVRNWAQILAARNVHRVGSPTTVKIEARAHSDWSADGRGRPEEPWKRGDERYEPDKKMGRRGLLGSRLRMGSAMGFERQAEGAAGKADRAFPHHATRQCG